MPSVMDKLRALAPTNEQQIDNFVDSLSAEETAELMSQPGFKEAFQQDVGGPARVQSLGVIQEQHPMISTGDRLLVQNLAASKEEGAAYLADRYKKQGLEVKIINDQIVVKGPKDKQFRVVDPDTGFFSSPTEFAKDAGDVAYDVGTGALLGAGTAALGPAAVGGRAAMAAAGVGGAGAEAMRQGLGQMAGINKGIDAEQVAMMGAVGAAGPAMQKGLGVAYDVMAKRIAPKAAAMSSGVPEQVWKHFQANPERQIRLSMDPTEFGNLVGETAQTIVQGFQNKEKELWGKMSPIYQRLDNEGNLVSTGGVIEDLDGLINKYTRPNPTPAELADVDTLKKLRSEYFQQAKAEADGTFPDVGSLKPSQAHSMRQKLDDLSEWERAPGASNADTITKEIRAFAKRGREKISEQLTQMAPELSALNSQYAKTAQAFKNVGKSFKDPQSTLRTMSSWDAQSKRMVANDVNMHLGEEFGQAIQANLDDIQVQKYLGNPASMAISNEGTTSTSRSVPLSTLLGSLGTLMGYKIGGGYAGAAVGGMAGVKIGNTLGSPAAIRSGMTKMHTAETMLQKAAPVVKPTLYGAWGAVANPAVVNDIQNTPPNKQK